jgi:carotenoid cleavage dioxygenase-like enzyme
MKLTEEQIMVVYNSDDAGIITKEDKLKVPGIHFCHDWDGMVVAPGCVEWDICTCFNKSEKEKIEAKYK